mmetsp:Transcript_13510/g.38399  ORF Transcript_13510/g.38399 Transcript_13510/m.38399 type:complete len:220 (+) Transcript_13510:243-902(+)
MASESRRARAVAISKLWEPSASFPSSKRLVQHRHRSSHDQYCAHNSSSPGVDRIASMQPASRPGLVSSSCPTCCVMAVLCLVVVSAPLPIVASNDLSSATSATGMPCACSSFSDPSISAAVAMGTSGPCSGHGQLHVRYSSSRCADGYTLAFEYTAATDAGSGRCIPSDKISEDSWIRGLALGTHEPAARRLWAALNASYDGADSLGPVQVRHLLDAMR